MKKFVWAYISHPYTGDEDRNKKEAAEIHRVLQKRYPDILFLNPLAMFEPIGDMEYEQVMEYCLETLQDSDMIVMSGDFSNSRGCVRELREARALGMPIRYYLSKTDPLAVRQPWGRY
jgi:hypothetical protein